MTVPSTLQSLTLQSLVQPLPWLQHLNPKETTFSSEPVTLVTSDSRKVIPGSIFVALAGSHTDGHQYLKQAAETGAIALVVQADRFSKGHYSQHLQQDFSVPVLAAENTYYALAALASRFYGEPGKAMRMIGVTGTNGKTTVTHLIERMLKDANQKTALIGTLGIRNATMNEGYQSMGHTTPMAPELQATLADMRAEGTEAVVMEVSSHALDQDRVGCCDYNVAVFTNLTQDHLDFHKTMDAYGAAKALLFSGLADTQENAAVINLDDPSAERFVKATPQQVRLYTYGINNEKAIVRAKNVSFRIDGSSFDVTTPEGAATVQLKLAGLFSIYNALAALSAGLALGIPLLQCIQSLEAVPGIRGRFEVVAENPFVIVDYAHTPDGLENVLSAARKVIPEGGKLICVFGCGGDRDATKRPKMGHIAERLADTLVVTSDNPRSEDPQQIITDVLSGIQRFDPTRMVVNADRKQAIHQAIDLAQGNDVIVVAGKGHEDYQILADRTIHFDDREVVQAYMAEW